MRRIFLVLVLFVAPFSLFSQSWEQIKENKDVYLVGEGWGETVDEADKQALANLISKISVSVESKFSQTEEEQRRMDSVSYSRYIESKIKTYSTTTLFNTNSIIIKNEPDAYVGRYIKVSELHLIYKDREAKVKEYVGNAIKAEKMAKVDDALRNYYWAYSLLKTIPHSPDIKYKDTSNVEHSLVVWIPNQMNEIFDNISPSVVSRNGDNLDLFFTYKGNPVTSLDYTFYDGIRWSYIYSAKGGKGTLELAPGSVGEDIQLKYEYAYKGESHIDKEVHDVLNTVVGNSMRKSYVNVKGSVERMSVRAMAKAEKLEKEEMDKAYSDMSVIDDTYIAAAMDKVIEAIRIKKYSQADDMFTSEGLVMYKRLMEYGNGALLGTPSYKILRQDDNIVVRSIPMSFSCPGNIRKTFVENIVFTFKNGKIDCLAFALDDIAIKDIMSNKTWSEKARMVIIEFLENYKTAFALERKDYIKTIFADDAVIIVGKIVKRAPKYVSEGNSFGNMSQSEVRKTQYNKAEYLKHLEMTFDSKEFINIRFSSNTVEKAGGTEVYGLQIKQDYFSNNYGDTGYLYLMVDINDPSKPLIRIRTWQPVPDYNVDPVDGLYDLYVL
mgnify:CR=1 FL=1